MKKRSKPEDFRLIGYWLKTEKKKDPTQAITLLFILFVILCSASVMSLKEGVPFLEALALRSKQAFTPFLLTLSILLFMVIANIFIRIISRKIKQRKDNQRTK